MFQAVSAIYQRVSSDFSTCRGYFYGILWFLSSVERGKTAVFLVLSRDKTGYSCQIEHFVA